MNTLRKIVESPERKKFREKKARIETAVNFRIEGHNSEYRKCEKTSDEGIEDRYYTRKLEIDEGRKIHSLAKKYGIKDYNINFKKLD